MQKVRHPMIRREAGSRDNCAGDGPVSDVFPKRRAQVVERFLLAFGHLDYVDSLRRSGRTIRQPEQAKVSSAASILSNRTIKIKSGVNYDTLNSDFH